MSLAPPDDAGSAATSRSASAATTDRASNAATGSTTDAARAAALARATLRAAWRAAGWYADLTIAEAVWRRATEHPDDRIVFAPADGAATVTTLAELAENARDLAGRLWAGGVRPGEAVVVQSPANAAGTALLIALWSVGAVVVPMTVTAGADELRHAVRQTAARTAVTASTWRGTDLASRMREVGPDRVFTIDGDGDADGGSVAASLLAIPASATAAADTTSRVDPSSVACVLYTSGSTAAPKGVRHSHETLLAGLTVVPADASTRMLLTFPAGHVASLLGLVRPLVAGGTTVVMDRWSARAAVELIEDHRITASAGTPFFLATMLDEAERSGRDISSLKRFLVGAATVSPELVERAEAVGITSWRTYGSTEHPAISAGGPDHPTDKRRLTDGRVAPGNEVRLIGSDGIDVGAGEEGEIAARGPKQFLGYEDPDADADAFFEETWFRTGDLARFDDDGYLVVTDRVTDIIIRGGENISAREVEEVLARHSSLLDVAVCAVPDDVWGEAVCAVVVLRPGNEQPTVAELETHARANGLAGHKVPSRVVAVEQLPRTAAGKVRKRDLRQLV